MKPNVWLASVPVNQIQGFSRLASDLFRTPWAPGPKVMFMSYRATPTVRQASHTVKAMRSAALTPLPCPTRCCNDRLCNQQGDYNQVDEWLVSPYSETEGGRGRVDCHSQRCSIDSHSGLV
jgi:hypothetical protein